MPAADPQIEVLALERKVTMLEEKLLALAEKPRLAIETGRRHSTAKHDHTYATGGDEYKAFEKFESQLKGLDGQLRELSNKARKLGSSVGILSASTRLRERLGRVLYLFRKNAAGLFPQKIPRLEKFQPSMFRRLVSKRHGFFDHVFSQSTELQPKHIALELQFFAEDIHTLMECFNQFPEFIDEVPDQAFSDELSQWAASLVDFGEDFESHAVQRYLFYSMSDIGDRLQLIADTFIPIFLKTGIPTVKASQEHSAINLVNLSTVATLFAGVAASMLQLTANSDGSRTALTDCVNVLWFIALIFSISAAVNSLLGLTWAEAIYRSPDHRVPWWVLIWIKHSPIVYLVLSVMCFFVGFVLFAFSSDQADVTRILTTVFSSISCCGLLAMSAWFACERWIYHRYEGYMWLSDALGFAFEPVKEFFMSLLNSLHPQNVLEQGKQLLGAGQGNANADPEKTSRREPRIGHRGRRQTSGENLVATQVSFWLAVDKEVMDTHEIARHRWQEAIRRTIEGRRERLADRLDVRGLFRKAGDPSKNGMPPHLRAASVTAHLARMTISQKLETDHAHDALVRFLQFSQDGKYLATSSWDKKSFILDVTTAELSHERSLDHSSGFGFVHQIEWSAQGDYLLMRHNKSISAWDKTGKRLWIHQRSDDDHPIRSVAWKGRGQEALSVEGYRIVDIDKNGEETQHHRIDNLVVRDVAVTSDSRYMICVGKHEHEHNHHEDKSAATNKKKYEIVLYDLVNFKVVKRAPVFHEMCDIALDCDDHYALVSYENRAPPQLWEFRNAQGKVNNVALKHTYMPKTPTAFAGLPAIFGGTHDHLVLRAGTASDIYVWDRDSTSQLHRIQAPVALGHLTAVAWNRGARDWMFATGTHEGEVHVWTVGPPPPPARTGSASQRGSASATLPPASARSSGSEGGDAAPAYVAGDYTQSPAAEHAPRPRVLRESTDWSSTAYSDDGGTARDEASEDGDDSD
ncbi:WD40 repeat-like protein [Phanerochaete sordida]|uniref:WD40 repeat-like protein n=1 Tax=Phanerochaete sordida TaxID=48140 RepID=A0A9P3FY05_9APHY|nr:WD40 repeat-like protein [Phanerochaete sordida]